MQIEIVNVSTSVVPTAKGSYEVADVAYKNKSFGDKLEGKKVMSFTNKDVFKTLKEAKFGDVFNVSRVKNDKGFWDWTAVGNANGSAPAVSATASNLAVSNTGNQSMKGNTSPKSTYETPEERAARQVLIVRQSSISSAVEFAVAHKVKDAQAVIAIAKEFEAYVFGKDNQKEAVVEEPEVTNHFADMPDDIPY